MENIKSIEVNERGNTVITKEYVLTPTELDIGIKDSIQKYLDKNQQHYEDKIFHNGSYSSGYKLAVAAICGVGVLGTSYLAQFTVFFIYSSIFSGFPFSRENRHLIEEKEIAEKRLEEVLIEKMGLPYDVFKSLSEEDQKDLKNVKILGRMRIEEAVAINQKEVKEFVEQERKMQDTKTKIFNVLHNLIGHKKLPLLDKKENRFLSKEERVEKELDKMRKRKM